MFFFFWFGFARVRLRFSSILFCFCSVVLLYFFYCSGPIPRFPNNINNNNWVRYPNECIGCFPPSPPQPAFPVSIGKLLSWWSRSSPTGRNPHPPKTLSLPLQAYRPSPHKRPTGLGLGGARPKTQAGPNVCVVRRKKNIRQVDQLQ